MKYFKIYIIIILLFISSVAQSSPLKFVPQKLKQPNGEIINCFASGDEFYSWLHDKDGFTIVQDENGYYVYAEKKDGLLIPTKNIVGKSDPGLLGIEKGLNLDKKYILEKVEQLIDSKTQLKKSSTTNTLASAPTKGTLNNLVIFIRFSDEIEFTENLEIFNSMFNNSEASANSLYNYYNEVSYGQLQIQSKFYPVANNNYIKSYYDSNPRNYYNIYTVTNQIGYKTGIEKTEREHTLLTNAVNSIKNDIPSSENFDADNDGNIDNVCFIVKGSPEVWSSLLWPHMWSLDSRNVYINGKKITTYNFQLEKNLLDLGVGVLCHEMFHSLGAPDLYHYSEDGITPVGEWDLMENTSNPPQHMSAYMKYRYGHWISSIPEISNSGTYYLNPLNSSKNNCFKITSPNSSSEYFVLEYRKKQGVFEQSLPSEGLLVYRIEQNSDGQGNARAVPDEIYLLRPGGSQNNNGEPNKANLNQNSGRTFINDFSDPAAVLFNGLPSGLDLYDVGLISDSISFKMKKASAYNLALTSPSGGENFKINNQTYITWINASVSDIKIELTTDGVTWNKIATLNGQSGISSGQYLWNVPSLPTSTAKIRISDLNDETVFSMSRNYFSITTTGQLLEIEPNDSNVEATQISIDETFEGDINPEGDADYYKFTAVAGDTIDVFASAKNSNLKGRILVLNDSGFITYDDGLYNDLVTNQRLSVLIPESGVYYIRYAFKDNFGSSLNNSIKSRRPENSTDVNRYPANLSNVTTGKYQITLKKFKSSPPDFSGFGGAWNLTQNSATLYWYVQENGTSSKYTFEYGTSNYYGNEIDERDTIPNPTYQENYISTPKIYSLLPNTTYHFRIKAVNKFGVFYSNDAKFTTASESDNWERQLVTGDPYFKKYFSFGENDGIIVSLENFSKTTDGGLNWSSTITYPNGFIASSASFINMNYGWIVGDDIYNTTDGGATWSKQNKPTTKHLTNVVFIDENNGWAVGMQGIIIHTEDGGKNWVVQEPGSLAGMWEGLFGIAFCDKNNGVASGTSGTLMRTTNSGLTWEKLQSGTTASLNGVHIFNPLIATTLGDGPCGGAGNILHTTNGGLTWVNQNNPTGEYLCAVDYLDANIGFGVGLNGSIAKTTDGGSTWVEQESGVRSGLRDVKIINSSKAVIVGDWGVILKTKDLNSKSVGLKSPKGNEVWEPGSVQNIIWQKNNLSKINIEYSTDNGSKWNTVAENIPASFNTYNWLIPKTLSSNCKIKIYDASDNNVESKNNISFTIGTVVTGLKTDQLPTEYSLSQNFPNPFNPSTTIEFSIAERGNYSLRVYNLLGQLTRTLSDGVYDPGYYKIYFNASKLASGIYIYKLSGNKINLSKKMLILK